MAAKAKKSILYIILILLAVICLMPFALMMVNATRSGSEIVHSFTLIPSNALAQNWETVSGYFDLFKGILNSLIAVSYTHLHWSRGPAPKMSGAETRHRS